MSRPAYVFDPSDPRAPTAEQWAALAPDERARVVAQLPSEIPTDALPGGGSSPDLAGASHPRLGEFFRHGLGLVAEDGRVRFFAGSAPLLEAEELISRLSSMVDELVAKEESLAQALEREQSRAGSAEQRAGSAEQRAGSAEQRAGSAERRAESAEQRAVRLAAQLRALGVEPED